MTENPRWKKYFFILSAITLIFFISLLQIEFGDGNSYSYTVFSVNFDYHGMDQSQIEKIITIPLEQKIMSLEGLVELKSIVEYGKSTTTAFFIKSIPHKNVYLNLRNSVEDIYLSLPSDVQKPRILSSSANDKAVFSAAFFSASDNNLRELLERNLKADMEAIDGIGQVIIAGGQAYEIEVAFDVEKAAYYSQNPAALSTIIQDANIVNSGSSIPGQCFEYPLRFDTRLKSLEQLRLLPVNNDESLILLDSFASVSKVPRSEREIVRINGKECVTLSVKAASSGNSILISKECKRIIKEQNFSENSYKILYDSGADLFLLIKKTILAAYISLLSIILVIPFFYNSFHKLFVTLIFLLINVIWTIGLLNFAGFSLNQNTLSGITLSLGLVSDSYFVLLNTTSINLSYDEHILKCRKLIPEILSASLTTLLVLIPLYCLDSIVPGVKVISLTIAFMIFTSILLSLIFFPVFIYEKQALNIIPVKIFNHFKQTIERSSIKCSIISIKFSDFSKVLYFLISILPLLLLFLIGKDINLQTDTSIIFSSVDFNSDYKASYVDECIQDLICHITKNPEVDFCRTECVKGRAEIEIGFNKSKTDKEKLADYISTLQTFVPDGFLYVSKEKSNRKQSHSLEIAFSGDEINECKKIAKEASQLLLLSSLCENLVYNFKDNERIYELKTDHERLIQNGINNKEIASNLRWMMYGPVADKWHESGNEMDIRIRGKNVQNSSKEKIENLYISNGKGIFNLNALGNIIESEGQGKIYRKNLRRCVYITAEKSSGSMEKFYKSIKSELSKIDLPQGYGFSFSKEVENLIPRYRRILFALFISILAILILLTMLTENFSKSLLISSIILPSFLLPLLMCVIFQKNLQSGDLTGMVLLSGIGVNNTIYLIHSSSKNIILKVRSRISEILAASITSILSSLPLLFIKGESFSKSLSFFMLFGVLNTVIICLIIFPGLIYKKSSSSLS